MRFLTPGNTEFAKSTGLPIPGNFRSRRLNRLLNALVQYQNAHNVTNLQEVVQAVSLWRRHNPKEVMLRGKKLKQLEAELESSRQRLAIFAQLPVAKRLQPFSCFICANFGRFHL